MIPRVVILSEMGILAPETEREVKPVDFKRWRPFAVEKMILSDLEGLMQRPFCANQEKSEERQNSMRVTDRKGLTLSRVT